MAQDEPLLILSAVYVLELEGGRIYVGQSLNLSGRLSQHWSRRGSQMTKSYRPHRVLEVHFDAGRDVERERTIHYAKKNGFDKADGTPNVRGSSWCSLNSRLPPQIPRFLVTES